MPISMFETRKLLKMLEQRTPPRTFLRDMFVSEVDRSEAENVDIDIIKHRRRLAPFVHPKVQGKLVEREGYQTSTIKPAYIKEKMVTTAEDVLKRSAGENIYAAKTPEMRAAEMLGRDLATLDEMIVRREEWMVAKGLFTGKIPVVGDGVNYEVDLGYETDVHLVTLSGGDTWDTEGVDVIANLRTWRRSIAQRSGLTADMALLGQNVVEPFLARIGATLDLRRVDLGQIVPQQLPNGVTYLGQLRDPGLDLYTYDEWYYDEDEGAEAPMVPVDAVLLAASGARRIMHYGAIKDMSALFVAERFAKSWEEQDPSARMLLMQSAPMYNPVQVDGAMVITVI